ncbi:hypothetical protein OGAPHI_003819 [Ogataea philodendri]|uniref:PUM-HD domain-containing protein n=1 Tax=Ogataea philodendri TaxID=1378263 RepID=A0A9P8T582_9ASCO|nr:uncharacterized protein OGAPHI_003819 [Ogataea philodendri]KAH3665631.1 hypothetical protein OGAPHI_003819 [Ogataea philodendri]
MADQTTLSSLEETTTQDVTTTTTPPMNDLSFAKKSTTEPAGLDDISHVLNRLNLDLDESPDRLDHLDHLDHLDARHANSSIFSAQFSPLAQQVKTHIPSTPPDPSSKLSSSSSTSTLLLPNQQSFSATQPRTPTWSNSSKLASFQSHVLPDLASTPNTQHSQFGHQFLSMTPQMPSPISGFAGPHGTPFSNPGSGLNFQSSSVGQFVLPENTPAPLGKDKDELFDPLSRASSTSSFGPPIGSQMGPQMGDQSRRLTYPLASPSQDTSISALHPALTNEMLAGTVAGGSIGMGVSTSSNGSSFPGSNLVSGYNQQMSVPMNSRNSYKSNYNGYSKPAQSDSPRPQLSMSATANVHRKHSSNKRRGEDASRFLNASLDDFVNDIYFLCKDQHGCRFLQRQLEIGGSEAATKIFNEIQLNVIELMVDPFGNYLIQKLLEKVNDEQRTTLFKNASAQFVRIALDAHGTRALQKLVECTKTQVECDVIVQALSSYVVLLSRDLNGNHVVQKCLQKLPPASCDFIFDAACDNCVKIAKHRHGCCVLQRCFDHGTSEQCERLALQVGRHCVELSTDPYGNYVVQYVLSMEENRLRVANDMFSGSKLPNTVPAIELVVNSLTSNLIKLSTHKFGSNVIEKSLRIPTLAPLLISQLLKETSNLKLLLHDAYGNYVLQTALDVADDTSFKDLSELLKPYLGDVRNTPHGRRILSKLASRGGSSLNGASFDRNSYSL